MGVDVFMVQSVCHENTHRRRGHKGRYRRNGRLSRQLKDLTHDRLHQGADKFQNSKLDQEVDQPAGDGHGQQCGAGQANGLDADAVVHDLTGADVENHHDRKNSGQIVEDAGSPSVLLMEPADGTVLLNAGNGKGDRKRDTQNQDHPVHNGGSQQRLYRIDQEHHRNTAVPADRGGDKEHPHANGGEDQELKQVVPSHCFVINRNSNTFIQFFFQMLCVQFCYILLWDICFHVRSSFIMCGRSATAIIPARVSFSANKSGLGERILM